MLQLGTSRMPSWCEGRGAASQKATHSAGQRNAAHRPQSVTQSVGHACAMVGMQVAILGKIQRSRKAIRVLS